MKEQIEELIRALENNRKTTIRVIVEIWASSWIESSHIENTFSPEMERRYGGEEFFKLKKYELKNAAIELGLSVVESFGHMEEKRIPLCKPIDKSKELNMPSMLTIKQSIWCLRQEPKYKYEVKK